MKTRIETTASSWFAVDKIGLRQTMVRNGKARIIFELLQNAWDEDATEVALTLTQPVDGKSTLICVDNSPSGYSDLSTAHTLFAQSYKKTDPTKRGRFNVGEKLVLALCDAAQITSTTGRTIFAADGTRKSSDAKTERGTEFRGELDMTMEEWEEVGTKVKMLFPPITTTYNGVEVLARKPIHTFQTKMLTEVADETGVAKRRLRKTEVRIYEVLRGEKSSLYEQGVAVVEIETKWHVDIQQKLPYINIERNNVAPSYRASVQVAVLNEMHEHLTKADATAAWVRAAMADKRSSVEAVKAVVKGRFGENIVSYDPSDIGANKEATSHDFTVVCGGSNSKEEWESIRRAEAMKPAGQVEEFKTNHTHPPAEAIPPEKWDADQTSFVRLIEVMSPILINHTVTVMIIDSDDVGFRGCTCWEKDSFTFRINLAHHDCSHWEGNYYLMLHELAHYKVQSNDHLVDVFYKTVNHLGAKLTQLALDQPELFKHVPSNVPEVVAA